MFVHCSHTLAQALGRPNQPRDRRGRWTATGAGARLGSQRGDFARALQHGNGGDNSGRSTVYAYLRDKDSPNGKAGSPYYVGVAGSVQRPYQSHGRTPVPSDERRVRVLRQGVTHEQAREWEKYYIEKFGRRDAGTGRKMLVNRTDGGDGVTGHSARTKAKLRAASTGKSPSAETKAKLSAALTGKAKSAEHVAKVAQANKGKPKSEETRRKISEAKKGRKMSPEAVARSAEAHRGLKRSDETRARMSATQTSLGQGKVRQTAAQHGVDASVWGRMTSHQRMSARNSARRRGVSIAEQIEKMRPKWGI